jgi:hypothetical protein
VALGGRQDRIAILPSTMAERPFMMRLVVMAGEIVTREIRLLR